MPPPRPREAPRDEEASAFTESLRRLVLATPGVLGAAFADPEGEAVDVCATGSTYDVKLAAAHLGIVLAAFERVAATCGVGRTGALHVRTGRVDYAIVAVGEGYYLVVAVAPGAQWPRIFDALDRAAIELRAEAGLSNGA